MVKTVEELFKENKLGKFDDDTPTQETVKTLCRALSTDDDQHRVVVLDELWPSQDEDWRNMKTIQNVDIVYLSKPSPDGYVVTPPTEGPGVRSYVLQHTYRQSHHTLMAYKYLRTHAGREDLEWSEGIVSDDDRSPQGAETVWVECTEEVKQVTVIETVKETMPEVREITVVHGVHDYDR